MFYIISLWKRTWLFYLNKLELPFYIDALSHVCLNLVDLLQRKNQTFVNLVFAFFENGCGFSFVQSLIEISSVLLRQNVKHEQFMTTIGFWWSKELIWALGLAEQLVHWLCKKVYFTMVNSFSSVFIKLYESISVIYLSFCSFIYLRQIIIKYLNHANRKSVSQEII